MRLRISGGEPFLGGFVTPVRCHSCVHEALKIDILDGIFFINTFKKEVFRVQQLCRPYALCNPLVDLLPNLHRSVSVNVTST
jgi:hypothetical protein